jgi:hypothetical protein
MNFKELASKLKAIDEGTIPPVDECGAMPLPGAIISAGPQGQQDNVSMTINVNGQGEGGLRSIMNILRNIEQGDDHAEHGHDEPIMGNDNEGQNTDSPLTTVPNDVEEVIGDDEEGWGNSAHGGSGHHTHGVDAVTFSGDDMNSKGKISPVSRAPGTNPLREPSQFDEALVNRLQAMYQQIKENQAGHDYQTGEPLKQGPDGKWYNSKGEQRDPLNGGPVNPNGSAKFRGLTSVPVVKEADSEKKTMSRAAKGVMK